jgi:hypothetical protein
MIYHINGNINKLLLQIIKKRLNIIYKFIQSLKKGFKKIKILKLSQNLLV